MPSYQRYIALLRAINVGGHTVKMDQLKTLVAELGFANVTTFIASGNVIFDAPAGAAGAIEAQVEQHLRQALGYDVATFVRSAAELAAIAGYTPFPPAEAAHGLYVSFLKAPLAEPAQRQLLALSSATDEFLAHEREFYWLCHTRLSDSPLSSSTLLAKTVGVPFTMRNITTVKKLAAKYAPAQVEGR